MQPHKLLLVCFGNRQYTPLDLAYTVAYLRKNLPSDRALFKIIPIFVSRSKKLMEFKSDAKNIADQKADTIIFSLDSLVWSGMFYEGIAIKVAKWLKKIQPESNIGFQSYKIDKKTSKIFLEKHKEADFVLRGEVENPLLDFFSLKNKFEAKGFSFRLNGSVLINADNKIIEKLDSLPSPYLEGVLDEFVKAKTTSMPSASFFLSTSRGCPYRCFYCFRSVKFDFVRRFSPARVVQELKYLAKLKAKDIFFLDDTFPLSGKYFEDFIKLHKKAFPSLREAPTISLMTRPELLNETNIAKLAEIKASRIHIGLQSINPKIQNYISREKEPDFGKLKRIINLGKKYKLKFKLDCIFGLPNDTLSFFEKTVEFVVSLRPWMIQIKQLYFNPGTRFSVRAKEYGIKPGKSLPRNVPFVRSSKGWTPKKMKEAYDFSVRLRKQNPDLKFKIVSEYGFIYDS